jgi:hypothetical protein
MPVIYLWDETMRVRSAMVFMRKNTQKKMGTNRVRGKRYEKKMEKMETIEVRGASVETNRSDVPIKRKRMTHGRAREKTFQMW